MMRAKASLAVCLLGASLGVGGCSSTGEPATLALATPEKPAPQPVVTPVAPPPPAPGVVGVTIGQSLDDKDRAIAIAAQQEAVSSGAARAGAARMALTGLSPSALENGSCRDYTHRIFLNGRPQEAKGQHAGRTASGA